MAESEAKLEVSFSLGRGKTIYVVGEYDHKTVPDSERVRFWGIVSQFGQELGAELAKNYKAKLIRAVLCEVDLGHIMFEIETDAPASIRRKVIEAVQKEFVTEEEKPVPLYKVKEPEGMQ